MKWKTVWHESSQLNPAQSNWDQIHTTYLWHLPVPARVPLYQDLPRYLTHLGKVGTSTSSRSRSRLGPLGCLIRYNQGKRFMGKWTSAAHALWIATTYPVSWNQKPQTYITAPGRLRPPTTDFPTYLPSHNLLITHKTKDWNLNP